MTDTIPIIQWGRDHWSTFGYIVSRIAEHGGKPDRCHLRTDPALHPGVATGDPITYEPVAGGQYATRLRESTVADHDDWSCLDDAEAAGLLTNEGTGIHRRYQLTKRGTQAALALHRHKIGGGSFATFVLEPSPAEGKMKTTKWSDRASRRSTHSSRMEEGAYLSVSRIKGAIKRSVPLSWAWLVSKGDQFRGPAYAERRGLCATEAEAQQAADDAVSLVVAAFTAFGVAS